MKKETFIKSVDLPASCEEVYAWHLRTGALARLIPPWEIIELLDAGRGIENGSRVELVSHVGPIACRWSLEHCDCIEGKQFRDVAHRSPFAYWNHLHRFEKLAANRCRLEDIIEYALPAGRMGRLLTASHVERRLQQMFRYRHDTLRDDLAVHARYASRPKMRICVTGSTGLIGSALVPFLTTSGHDVLCLTRRADPQNPSQAGWDPMRGQFPLDRLDGVDAVIHLAGENVASGRWNNEKKQRILDSRTIVTRLLCENLARLQHPPRVLLSASAVGIYGSQADTIIDESATEGKGFLAEVCHRWEAASEPARNAGIRVARLRFGAVLSPRGGMLAKLLPMFRLGLAGRVGDGRHWQSWISIDDAIGAIYHAAMEDLLEGPINVVSPEAVTNAEFTSKLARILHRPAVLTTPAWVLRAAVGQMADELLLSSIRTVPKRLIDSGYVFRQATLSEALKHVLGQ